MTEAFKQGFMDKMAELEKDSNWLTDAVVMPAVNGIRRAGGAVARGAGRLFGRGAGRAAETAAPEAVSSAAESAAASAPTRSARPGITIKPLSTAAPKPVEPPRGVEIRHIGPAPKPVEPPKGVKIEYTGPKKPTLIPSDTGVLRSRGGPSSQEWADIDQAVRDALRHPEGQYTPNRIEHGGDLAARVADRMTAGEGAFDTGAGVAAGRELAENVAKGMDKIHYESRTLSPAVDGYTPQKYDPFDLRVGTGTGRVYFQPKNGSDPVMIADPRTGDRSALWHWPVDETGASGQEAVDRAASYFAGRENHGWTPSQIRKPAMDRDLASQALAELDTSKLPNWRPGIIE